MKHIVTTALLLFALGAAESASAAPGQPRPNVLFLFDVMPTLGALCGVAAPKTSEGLDLTATLRKPATPARPVMMFAYRDVQRALRDERWKLIRYPQVDRTQLFDLVADPFETKNLAALPAHAAKVAELTGRLESEMRRNGDHAMLIVTPARPAAWSPPQKK